MIALMLHDNSFIFTHNLLQSVSQNYIAPRHLELFGIFSREISEKSGSLMCTMVKICAQIKPLTGFYVQFSCRGLIQQIGMTMK